MFHPIDNDSALLTNPDAETDQVVATMLLPLLSRGSHVALVFAGGTLGTAARETLISIVFPAADGIPYLILTINAVDAFLLMLRSSWGTVR